MDSRLVRNPNDKVFAGVCGGLASYFGIDSTVVRLLFVLAVLSGLSPLVYIVLWIIMPEVKVVAMPHTPAALPQQPLTYTPSHDPTGEWKFDPYTGQPVKK